LKSSESDDAPVLITDAARSYEDEFSARKRRYSIMMGMRVPFLVLAAVFYQTPWLAATLIGMSVPLPWCAVLIANDRLPRKSTAFRRFRSEPELTQVELLRIKELESGSHEIIDS
jgi:Protein of unknown function (DUF3099)